MPTFIKDLHAITKDNPIYIASLQSGKVRNLKVSDNVNLDICEVDNKRFLSHCGLFIMVDGKNVVGGEPFVTSSGEPVDVLFYKSS